LSSISNIVGLKREVAKKYKIRCLASGKGICFVAINVIDKKIRYLKTKAKNTVSISPTLVCISIRLVKNNTISSVVIYKKENMPNIPPEYMSKKRP